MQRWYNSMALIKSAIIIILVIIDLVNSVLSSKKIPRPALVVATKVRDLIERRTVNRRSEISSVHKPNPLETTGSIFAVIAEYRYAPEILERYAQVVNKVVSYFGIFLLSILNIG